VTIHLLEMKAPSLDVPRMHPCEAGGTGPHAQLCGATPASLWRKSCANGHDRDVRLCGSHARLITMSLGACRECTDHGFQVAAKIEPVEMLLAK
jgi:hypothetical protein